MNNLQLQITIKADPFNKIKIFIWKLLKSSVDETKYFIYLNKQLFSDPLSVEGDSGVGSWWHLTAWWMHRQDSNQHVLTSIRQDEGISNIAIATAWTFHGIFGAEALYGVENEESYASGVGGDSLEAAIQESTWTSGSHCLEAKACE